MKTVSCTYLATIIDACERHGADRILLEDLVKGGGEALKNRSARFSSETLIRVLNTSMVLTGDPDIGLKVGMQLRPESFMDVGYALSFCDNLKDAMNLNTKYQALTQQLGRTKMDIKGEHALVRWEADYANHELHRYFVDVAFTGYATIGRWLVYGAEDAIVRMSFRHSAPSNTELYEAIFGPNIEFGADHDEMVLPEELARIPLASRNPEMKEILVGRLDEQLGTLGKPQSFKQKTKHILLAGLADGRPQIPEIAKMMGMSERSFRRRLVDEDITFRDVLEEARREACEIYLRKGDMTHLDIAHELGYKDQSSYSRAFKHWFGVSPREYRKDIRRKALQSE